MFENCQRNNDRNRIKENIYSTNVSVWFFTQRKRENIQLDYKICRRLLYDINPNILSLVNCNLTLRWGTRSMFHRLEDNLDIPTHTRRAIGSPQQWNVKQKEFLSQSYWEARLCICSYLPTSLEVVAVSHSAALDILWSGSSSFHIGSS